MQKAFILCAAAVLLAGCEEPHYSYPPPPEAPMAPQPMARPAPRSYSTPAPAPRTVKPLRMGLLTAKNVGDYMDNEEKELRANLRGSGAGVGRPGDAMTVYLRNDVLFEPDSVKLSPHGTQILFAIAAVSAKYDSTAIAVNGYTDTSGSPDRDLQLSQQRAAAVSEVLVTGGIDAHRIETHGFGATHLKIPTGAGMSEPRNRRVEIVITPKMAA
jgi:outer membrane protein OmpA-like peptidoglycan-associated protein